MFKKMTALLLISLLGLSACALKGALYFPPQEQTQPSSAQSSSVQSKAQQSSTQQPQTPD